MNVNIIFEAGFENRYLDAGSETPTNIDHELQIFSYRDL